MNNKSGLPEAPVEDTRAAHAVPTTFSNRFHLTANDMLMRATFGEQMSPDAPTNYHLSVTLPRGEAILLAQMILQMYQVGPAEKTVN